MAYQDFGVDINLKQNQILKRVIEKLVIAPSTPIIGQEYYNIGLNKPYFWDGSTWKPYSGVNIYNEIPPQTIDGSNTVFTTLGVYTPTKTRVYLNGQRLSLVGDYNESAPSQITFLIAPMSGDKIIIDYS